MICLFDYKNNRTFNESVLKKVKLIFVHRFDNSTNEPNNQNITKGLYQKIVAFIKTSTVDKIGLQAYGCLNELQE